MYFITVCNYLIAKLPLHDEVLTRAEVADISLQTTAKSEDLVFFVKMFPALMPVGSTYADGCIRRIPMHDNRRPCPRQDGSVVESTE